MSEKNNEIENQDMLKNEQKEKRLKHTSDMILKAIRDLDERFKKDPEEQLRNAERLW